MSPKVRRLALAVSALVAATAAAEETPRLFEILPGEAPGGRGLGAAWRVAVDAQLLLGGADRVRLDLPDGLELTAVRRRLERRGTGSALWRGALPGPAGGEVILTVHDGVVAGYVTSAYGEYAVRSLPGGEYRVAKLERDRLPGCGARGVASPAARGVASPAERAAAPAPDGGPARDGAGSIDMLVLYTPEAGEDLGTNQQVRAHVQMMVDVANRAFARSRMSARLNLVHVEQSSFPEAADSVSNLIAVQESAQAAALREVHKADLVALIVARTSDYCGIAHLMTFLDPQHFATLAFSVTHQACIDSFGHEVGHNLGFHHDPENAPTQPYLHVFPWAFGHYESDNFATMMAYPYPCGSCERILNFSNPRVNYRGLPTGIVNQRDNARVGEVTAPLVANYRRSGRSFDDDFEDGDLAGWSHNQGPLALHEPGLGGSAFALEVPVTGTPTKRFLKHPVAPPGAGLDIELTLNMSGVELGAAEVEILSLVGRGQPHTSLRVRQIGGDRWLVLHTRGDEGGFTEVARTYLRADVDERIRLEWRRSTSALVPDGFVRLLKNGGSRGFVRGLDNDTWPVRTVFLGAPSGTAGTPPAGLFLVDDYAAVIPSSAPGTAP